MSKIEWTNKTWNPTTGCTHYSSEKNGGNECLNCYAEVLHKRLKAMGDPKYQMGFNVVVEHEDVLDEPYSWNKPCSVFVNSMSDLLHKDISGKFIKKVFDVMNNTLHHTYQVLSKRHTRFELLPDDLVWSDNIWMGISCGTQYSTRRIPALVESNAKHKFLSIEPFINEITDIDFTGIDWVIVGGESGNNSYRIEKNEKGEDKYQIINGKVAYSYELDDKGNKILEKKIRPMKKEWVETIKDKCEEKGIPFFFKQWGKVKNNPNPNDPTLNKEHRYYAKGGCQLNGKIYWENPTMENSLIPIINVFDEDYYVMDQYEELNTIWELKSHLPMINKDAYSELKKNIKQNGINDPILYFETAEGKKLVIDGHSRLKACIDLKIKNIPTKKITECFSNMDEVKFWMAKNQLVQRNLSPIEKVRLAYTFKPTIEKLAKINLSNAGKASSNKISLKNNTQKITPVDTYLEIAKIAGVGRTQIVNYTYILKNATNAFIENLHNGNISISAAYNLLPKKNKQTPENSIPILPKEVMQPEEDKNLDLDIQIKIAEPVFSDAKDILKDNKFIAIKSKPAPTPIQSDNIIVLNNFSEGEQKLLSNEIDVIMTFNQNDNLGILKNNPDLRIGVYFLTK